MTQSGHMSLNHGNTKIGYAYQLSIPNFKHLNDSEHLYEG